jgi:hypothetical protein
MDEHDPGSLSETGIYWDADGKPQLQGSEMPQNEANCETGLKHRIFASDPGETKEHRHAGTLQVWRRLDARAQRGGGAKRHFSDRFQPQ